MTGASAPNDADYRRRCAELEGRLVKLETETKMREELLAFKATVTAVVARGIDAKHGEEALQEIWEEERAKPPAGGGR
ncbi:MAG: hypothetical protein QW338_00865 [Conexivisphaerales archaeon]